MKTINDYAELVKAEHALNKTIAPVEDGANIAGSYTSGEQFIRDGVLYTALTTIATNTAWSSLTLDTDYKLADDITSQLASLNQTLTNDISDINTALGNEVATRAKVSGHNFVPFPYYTNSIEIAGITWTTYSDGRVKANGTATALSIFDAINTELHSPFSLEQGDYVLTDGLSASDYEMAYSAVTLMYSDGTVEYNHADTSIGKNDFAMPAKSSIKQFYLGLCIKSGETVNDLIFYPMIRLASDKDTTYQPYSMTNQELTPIAQAVSNRNLLDNPWFTVNQRGFSSKNDNGFTVDRWQILQAAGTVSLSNGAITIDPTVSGTVLLWGQTIEDALTRFAGKTLTLSVLLSDGTIKSKVFEYPTNTPSNSQVTNLNLGSTHYIEIYAYASGHARCGYYNDGGVIPSSPLTIKAVKLELGSVSTLAQDTVPNYQQELAKCQRYFVRLAPNSSDQYGVIGQGIMYSDTLAWIPLNMPVAMRVKPSISYNLDSGKIKITGKGLTAASGKAVTAITVNDRQPMQLLYFTCASQSDLSAGDAVLIWFVGTTDAFIDLSADL